MGLQHYVQWVDAPGSKTSFKEGRAGIQQLTAEKVFSPDRSFNLLIAKTTLYEGCDLSSKLLPLVVAMWERKRGEGRNDFYSFDNNGFCLSHGYSIAKDGKLVVVEAHDTDVGRLIERGGLIMELIGDYNVPMPLTIHPTVIDLRNNALGK